MSDQPQTAPDVDTNAPFKDELTIIWATEKAELHGRLDIQELVIEQLASRVATLEAWAIHGGVTL